MPNEGIKPSEYDVALADVNGSPAWIAAEADLEHVVELQVGASSTLFSGWRWLGRGLRILPAVGTIWCMSDSATGARDARAQCARELNSWSSFCENTRRLANATVCAVWPLALRRQLSGPTSYREYYDACCTTVPLPDPDDPRIDEMEVP